MKKIMILILILYAISCAKALTWEEDTGNPIFSPGKAYYPSVLKVGSEYKMWYDTNTAGRHALATSSNGIDWVYQSDTSGLTTPKHSTVKYFETGFSTCGAQSCHYRIWYWPSLSYSINDIRYAESYDGITWYNDQPLQNGAVKIIGEPHPDWNRGSYGPADIIYNPSALNTGINPFDYTFAMYYDGTTGGDESIGLGYSSDGITWEGYDSNSDGKADAVFTGTDNPSDWDADYASRATIIKNSDNDFEMWYSGGIASMNHGIGHATSTDGINWIRDENNPIFHKNDGETWRDSRSYTPVVIKEGNDYKMWFTGKSSAGVYSIGYATASSTQTFDILLEADMNLISLPLNPTDSSISAVMGVCDYVRIWEFNPSTGWTSTDTGLTEMDVEHGYWIDRTGLSGDCTITINGQEPASTIINIAPGQNLVGYPSLTQQAIADVIIPNSLYDRVWEFSPATGWTSTDTGLTDMTPGKGYFVDSSTTGSYTVIN